MQHLYITTGDPAGVGPEVSLAALQRLTIPSHIHVTIVTDSWSKQAFSSTLTKTAAAAYSYEECITETILPTPGMRAGHTSFALLQRARECIQQKLDQKVPVALVTAPVSKYWIQKSGTQQFTEHTSWLGESFTSEVTMLMSSPRLHVGLVTTHIPLSAVPGSIQATLLDTTLEHCVAYAKTQWSEPRIGVLGLNPHAGEQGLFGNEELETVIPAIQRWQVREPLVQFVGPLSADTAFYAAYQGQYHLLIAMYHDQALAPFKSLCFLDGFNETLGLPFVRTSPAHGTAYDIVGRNLANPQSMQHAIQRAVDALIRQQSSR